MRTILVTAASGNAGRNAVYALLVKGFRVIATSREPEKLTFPESVVTRVYDANDPTDFDYLLEGVDDVLLIGPPLDGLVHKKLAPLIDAVSARKATHLIYLSGNYLCGFSGTSLAALAIRKVELQVIQSGLAYTVVRAGFFMDNFLSGFYSSMVDLGQLSLAVGDARSAFVAAADVGEFISEAFSQHLLGEYVVTGPESLDHHEVSALLSLKLNRPICYEPISEEQLKAIYLAKNLPPDTIEYGLNLYGAVRNHATAAITDSFKQATLRSPRSFRAYLELE